MQPNGNVIVDTICRTAKLGTTITGATENGDVTVIEAEPVEPINECPTCGQPGVFRDHVIRSLVDLPIVGHPTTSCAPSTLPVHQQALLAEDLPCWPCLRARQFKDHGPGDPLDPATTLPKSDERCRCTQVIRPGVGYEVSQVLFRLMKPVFETTYGAQRTPMPKLPQHRLPHQTHDSGIHTLNPHACMAWKNQAEPARLVSAWDDPARLDRLVGDLIDADDGGGCFYTDAQPIDYTQGMDYSPQQLAADSGLGDTVPLACESNASYSLAHHPDIKFTATGSPDGRKALEVSAPGSARHALITAKPGTFDVSLHDERGIVSGESFPYEANDSWTYRLSGQALRGALDLAVGWADPQETSPETAGLGLALDDGMETTHGR